MNSKFKSSKSKNSKSKSSKSKDEIPPPLPLSSPPRETELSYYISLHDTPPSTPAPEKPPRTFSTSNHDEPGTSNPNSSNSDASSTPIPDSSKPDTSTTQIPDSSKPDIPSTPIPDSPNLNVPNPPSPDSSLSPSEVFQTPPDSLKLSEGTEKPPTDTSSKPDGEIPTVTVLQAEGDGSGAEDIYQDAEDQSSVLLRTSSTRRRASSRASREDAGDSTLKRVSAKIDRLGSAFAARFLDREKISDSDGNTGKRNSLTPFTSDFFRRSFRQKSSAYNGDASPPRSEVSSFRGSVYNEDLVSSLKCAACGHYMVGPIEQCKRGHNICIYCWRRAHNFRCPVCKGRMSGIRNYLAEDMARKLLFPCVHAHAGCTRQVPNDELEAHQPRCPYRVYNCLINVESHVPCKWEGRRTYLEEHVRAQHPRYYSAQVTTTWRWSPNLLVKMEDFQLISAFGELFWYCAAPDPERLRICWFVQHVGYDEDSSRFEFNFSIVGEEKDRRLEMTCTALPDYSTVNSIVESGHCLDMSYQQALSFVDEEGTIRFSVTISKLD